MPDSRLPNLNTVVRAARGGEEVDLLLQNGRIVNVFSGRVEKGDIAIHQGWIIGLSPYPSRKRIDLENRFVAPGFIDPHVHIESSLASVTEFARAVAARGTTTAVADPHEIANVLGTGGIDYMLSAAEGQPMNLYFTLPSCVPATDLESSGARLTAADLAPYLDHPRIVGLAEMMNFPGVIHEDPDVLDKIRAARARGKRVDGHAPGLSGRELSAYLAAGIHSDHECTTADEAAAKLSAGMHIMLREGTGARNVRDLLPIVNSRTSRRLMWCTDDRHPHDLLAEGHVDAILRLAIGEGLDPVTAIQMATVNPAEYFRLAHVGAIAPGRQADLVVFSQLERPNAEMVFHKGNLVAADGMMLPETAVPAPVTAAASMHPATAAPDFALPAAGSRVRAIEVVPGQILTRERLMKPSIENGMAVSDPRRDLLKIAVVERHRGTGNAGIGFVNGFGLHTGALASSVAHDSHNIIVVGACDADMAAAVREVILMGGGLATVKQGRPLAHLPLPIAGLMTDSPLPEIRKGLDHLTLAARDLGCGIADPFMALSFMALPVIPALKITDKGLVDVGRFRHVPLFVA